MLGGQDLVRRSMKLVRRKGRRLTRFLKGGGVSLSFGRVVSAALADTISLRKAGG